MSCRPPTAKQEHLTIVHTFTDNRGTTHRAENVALGFQYACLLIVLAGIMFAADGHFTWHRYVVGRQISNKTVPKWQTVLARLYIWLFIVVPW